MSYLTAMLELSNSLAKLGITEDVVIVSTELSQRLHVESLPMLRFEGDKGVQDFKVYGPGPAIIIREF